MSKLMPGETQDMSCESQVILCQVRLRTCQVVNIMSDDVTSCRIIETTFDSLEEGIGRIEIVGHREVR